MLRLALTTVLATLNTVPQRPSVLASKLDASSATVHRRLKDLLEAGLVVREGRGPTTAYRALSAMETIERGREQLHADERVRLTLTRAAAHALTRVLDLNMRTGIGQLEAIAHRLRDLGPDEIGLGLSDADYRELEGILDACKGGVLGLSVGATYGINSPKVRPDVKLLWGIQRALRHRLAWDETAARLWGEGRKGVYHDEPLGGDKLTMLWVHSEAPERTPGSDGLPQRYVLEMPKAWVKKVERAVGFGLSIYLGDLTALVSFVEAGLLLDNDGEPISPEGIRALHTFMAAAMARIHHGPAPLNLAVTDPGALLLLKFWKAMQAGPVADVAVPTEEAPAVLSNVEGNPWAVEIDELPAGLMLNFKDGEYRVLAPSNQSDTFTIVAQSHSVQTAVEMAKTASQASGFA